MNEWSLKAFVVKSWELMSKQFFQFLGAMICASVIPGLSITFGVSVASSGLGIITQIIGGLLVFAGLVVTAVLSVNITRLALLVADGTAIHWRQVLTVDWSLVKRFWLTTALLGLFVIGGLILLIVPGIIFALKYGQAPFVAVDTDTWGMDALKESKKLTNGMMKKLLLWGLLTALVVGVSSRFIGSAVIGMWTPVLSALIYYQLVKRVGSRHREEKVAQQAAPVAPSPINQYQV